MSLRVYRFDDPDARDIRLSEGCGHHCGIRSSAEDGGIKQVGHCGCAECRCPLA